MILPILLLIPESLNRIWKRNKVSVSRGSNNLSGFNNLAVDSVLSPVETNYLRSQFSVE